MNTTKHKKDTENIIYTLFRTRGSSLSYRQARDFLSIKFSRLYYYRKRRQYRKKHGRPTVTTYIEVTPELVLSLILVIVNAILVYLAFSQWFYIHQCILFYLSLQKESSNCLLYL